MVDPWEYSFEGDDPLPDYEAVPPFQPVTAPDLSRLRIPKDQEAICYVCGSRFQTYRGLRTIPPDPNLIHAPSDPDAPLSASIEPVAVCSNPACDAQEMRRQDAVFTVLVQPIREKFLAERQARLNSIRGSRTQSKENS